MCRVLRSEGGFTYIAALVMVVIVGIMSARAAEVWKTKMQRERETELIYRGTQVRDALRRWYGLKPGQDGRAPTALPANAQGPTELKDLLQDPRSGEKKRYLRASALLDPMTGKDWELVKDTAGKVIGVKSSSEAEPIKQANFPFDLEPADFEAKKKYNEWLFVATRSPAPAATGGTVTGLDK